MVFGHRSRTRRTARAEGKGARPASPATAVILFLSIGCVAICGVCGGAFYYFQPHVTESPEAVQTLMKALVTIDVPQSGADGVLVAEGGAAGGFTLYVKEGKPIYEYNYMAHARYKVASSETLAPGPDALIVAQRNAGLSDLRPIAAAHRRRPKLGAGQKGASSIWIKGRH